MTKRHKLLIAALLGSLVVSLAGCNTVKGVGRDIESVGQAGERAL
jgi:entericidin B